MSVLANPLVAAIVNPVIASLKKVCQAANGQPDADCADQPQANSLVSGVDVDSVDGQRGKTPSQPAGLTVASLLKQYAPQFVKKYPGQAVPQVQSTLAKLTLCHSAWEALRKQIETEQGFEAAATMVLGTLHDGWTHQ